MISKLKLDKEKLQFIKLYLEEYKQVLLKEEGRLGENIRKSCNITELVNVLNYHIGNFFEVIKHEIEDRYIGNRMATQENFPEKTIEQIIERLEQLLLILPINSSDIDSFLFGLMELRKRLGGNE